jgi:ubiquinone/menaquinone biosynthesis C-methylase UbiE
VFDQYRDNYAEAVQASVSFSGLPYEYFLRTKAQILRQILAERLPDISAPRLLDVGCGVGALHGLLRDAFGEIHGVDVSRECIERACLDHPWARYDTIDGERLPVDDGAFDVVLAVCVAHHVAPRKWPAWFAELRRVAAKGGLVCLIEHNPFNPLTRLSVMRCAFDRDANLIGRGHMVELLAAAGLSDIASRYFVLAPFTGAIAMRAERALSWAPLGAQYAAYGQA